MGFQPPILNQHQLLNAGITKVLLHFFFHCLSLPLVIFSQKIWVMPKHIWAGDYAHFGGVMDTKSSPTFQECPPPVAFTYCKDEAKFIMNQTYVDHKAY
jgi:hypothetical protein